jgi:hypothetical protein
MAPSANKKKDSYREWFFYILTVLVVVAVVYLAATNSSYLKTQTIGGSSPSPEANPIERPAEFVCSCGCDYAISNTSSEPLCRVRMPEGRQCAREDYEYDFRRVTDEASCNALNGKACRGYNVDGTRVIGKLAHCDLVAEAAPTPTPSKKPSPTPTNNR